MNRRYLSPLVVFLLYALVGIFATWPLIPQIGTHIPGELGDAYAHLWTFSWIKSTLLSHQSPYFTNLLFFPDGANLTNHNIAWTQIAGWLPLQAVLGPEISYSLIFWITFPLNSLALFLLAREHTGSTAAAFAGGLIAGFWPYNLSHFDHPNLILICWLPLALLFIGKTMTQQRFRYALLAAIFIALLGITRWQLLIMSAAMMILYVSFILLTNPKAREARSFILLGVTGLAALLIMLPLLYPMLNHLFIQGGATAVLQSDEDSYGTDLLAYLVPNRYHPLWGSTVAVATRPFAGNNVYSRTVGYSVLILIVIGIIKRFRDAWFWLLTAVVYLLFSLGPQLSIYGKPTIPLPYKLIEDTVIMQFVRFPDRYNVILSIPVAMLAAYGVTVLIKGATQQQTLYRTAAISGVIMFEYMMTFSMLPLYTPPWYETLAQEPERFGVIDIPLHVETFDTYYNYYQLTHGKPLVTGHVSRPSQDMLHFVDNNPFLSSIYGRTSAPDELPNVQFQLRSLYDANIRYLILHKELLDDNKLESWREWLVAPPVFEDDDLLVYETKPRQLGTDIPWVATFADDAAGLTAMGLLRSDIVNKTVTPGYWVEVDAVWGSLEPITKDLDACIHLLNSDGKAAATNCALLSPDYPTSHWVAGDYVHESHQLNLSPFEQGGSYTIGLSLMQDGRQLGQIAEIGSILIEPLARDFEIPEVSHESTASWENKIALLGYDENLTATALELTLYWQALNRISSSYKIFVHLIDPASGQVVSQVDTVPHDWSYPTDWWEKGEVVKDTLLLSLEGVPAGIYEIYVGLVDPATNERLTVTSDNDRGGGDIFLLNTINRRSD